MADILCKKCGEPWDLDELHFVDGMTFDEARRQFYTVGCEVFGTKHSEIPDGDEPYEDGEIIGMLQDLLGDDIDGLAATLEDFRL